MFGDRVVELRDAIEREEPDAQAEGVVLVEGRLDERVVGAPVDVAVDPLVEVDECALVVRVARAGKVGEEGASDVAVVGIRTLGGKAGREALEGDAGLREGGEVTDLDGRDDDAAPGVDLDELLLCERSEGLPDGRASEPEALHELALADR